MAIDAAKALQYEAEFLSGAGINFESAKGTRLRGTMWRVSQRDDGDRLRALMASHHNYDRERLKSLPSNRRIALHGSERRFLFGKRKTSVAIASVLTPLDHFAKYSGEGAPPIDLGELSNHVRELITDVKVPHVIGVCSPTGFTNEARAASLSAPNVTVVLIEPDGRGGWRTIGAGENVAPHWLEIFDPEGAKQKLKRVGAAIEAHSADLLTGGLAASAIARHCNLPEHVVRQGFRKMADTDAELRVTDKEGQLLLYRGAAVQRKERHPMNVIDRIKQLFSGDGDDAEKINLLSERRASLAQRRDRIYEDIGKLEKKEADLLDQGKAAKSQVPRRRLAAQLAQLRKDIARQNTTAAMLNQQINIISTDIHNLTLLQQGEAAKLPDTTELTEHAVQAEEMLETLRADSELVGSLETGIESTMTSVEEMAILQEFEEADEPATAAEAAALAPPKTQVPPVREALSEGPTSIDPDRSRSAVEKERADPRPADPEAT
ncbi:MAG: hypothetical protein KJ749_14500 [Planctomycetes bacterium]|nr:hypothetical protein [Planctomycetota bacterium]